MEITITLEIERALKEEALKQGTTPELLALDTLRKRFVPSTAEDVSAEEQGTLADFLKDHIGVLSSSEYVPGGAAMSEESGKKFTAGLIRKRQQGRL